MLFLNLLDIASVVLGALILGVFWGPWLALTRSLDTLTPSVFLTIVHRLDKNLGRNMTVLYPVTLVSIIAMLIFSFASPVAFWLTTAGFAMFVLALIVTSAIEVPIVTQIRGWTETTMPANWQVLRDRWVSFHLLRVIPGILGVGLLTAGAVWQR
jgi:MFS-type transporter involved in bile tolerance (Atg22 family)